jgi:hypothetical protein
MVVIPLLVRSLPRSASRNRLSLSPVIETWHGFTSWSRAETTNGGSCGVMSLPRGISVLELGLGPDCAPY